MVMYVRRSSAYFISSTVDGIASLMDMMKRRKRVGPTTLPWVTPASTGFHEDVISPILTRCCLFERYAAIHDASQFGSDQIQNLK